MRDTPAEDNQSSQDKEKRSSSHRRGATAMLLGQVARVTIQGAYFVLLARSLEVDYYGAVAASLALTAMVAPFSNLGSALLLLKNVSRDQGTAPVQWMNTVLLTIVAGGSLALLLAIASGLLAPASVSALFIASVAVSDLVLARLTDAAATLYQAFGQMGRSASLQATLQLARLLTLVVLIATAREVTPSSWATSYLAASFPIAAASLWIGARRAGPGRPSTAIYFNEWRTGALFSIGMSSQTIYNDVDKAILGRLSTLEATGTYSAAYRIVDMSYVPIRSLLAATYPEMMRAGEIGLASVLTVVRRRIAVPATVYCICGCLAMLFGAPLIVSLLGSSFSGSEQALRLLSLILIFKGLHYVAADTLTTANRQAARTAIQVVVAVANIALGLALIPEFGWQGAVTASLLSDGLLAISLWCIIVYRLRN